MGAPFLIIDRKATPSYPQIGRERGGIQDFFADNPGLKSKQDEALVEGYFRGRREAAVETGLTLASFPVDPPFTRDQAESFWPKGVRLQRAPGKPKRKS